MVSIYQLVFLDRISSLKSLQFFLIVIFFTYVSTVLSDFSSLCYLCSLFFVLFHLHGIPCGLAVRIPGFHPGGRGSTIVLFHLHGIPCGLAVRIPGFHPGGPGSTPGIGIHFLSVQTSQVFSYLNFFQALR